MNFKAVFFVLGALVFGATSCNEELEMTEAPEEVQDSLLLPETMKIEANAIIAGRIYNWDSEEIGFGNGVGDTTYAASCYSGGQLKEQNFYFANFTDTLSLDSVYGKRLSVQIAGCAPIGSTNPVEDSIIYVGSYDYGNPFADSNGVVVTFLDDTGAVWSSILGPGITGQPGSTFTITDMVENYDGFSYWVIAGDFNCTLYDVDGNSIVVSEASFISRVGKLQ